LRMDFADALELFPDGYFQFIYVDAYAHAGQQAGRLLSDWWPKLKSGGIFAGHDYDSRWPKTVAAVDAFTTQEGCPLNRLPGVSTANPEDGFGSWWTSKEMPAR